MTGAWKTKRLKEVAEVRVSNVDKKSFASELPVHLCNYMDVYANDYVVSSMPFMAATATKPEIARFGLRRGDVMITKDSETPDDIGIPSVVVDEIENLVCGYHLALIRPRLDEACPVYLAKQLATEQAKRYFGVNASGSTRFGIPVGAIENFELPLPELPEQSKIAEVLSTVDQAIAQSEALIAKQQRIKTGLMQDLLTRGIDENGHLRSEATHAFKDSPLGRIPVEWECDRLGTQICSIEQGWSPDCEGDCAAFGNWGVLKTTAVTWTGYQDYENKALPENLRPRIQFEVQPDDVLMTRAGPNSRVGVVAHVRATQPKLMLSDKLYRLRNKDSVHPEYLALTLASVWTQRHLSTLKTGLAESQTNISQEIVRALLIKIPEPSEQTRIVSAVRELDRQLLSERAFFVKLQSHKTALMQDLLTGKIRVTPLLKPAETGTA